MSTTPSTIETKGPTTPQMTTNGGRLPSLNQLAARINPATSPASAVRPRLPVNVLRTQSGNISTVGSGGPPSAVGSAIDSMAVEPSTRSASPALSSVSAVPGSRPASPPPGGDDHITAEKLEKLDKIESQDSSLKPPGQGAKAPSGYKNVPSLDAIAARLKGPTRQLSVDGSPRPAEVDDTSKTAEHPLQYSWTIYYDTKSAAAPAPGSITAESEYEAGLTVVGDFKSVEGYCRYFNWLKPPSNLERNSNYHLFKSGIKPMWEDDANANGGKWVLTMRNSPQLLDRCWAWLTMALVGEEIDEHDEVCGAVVSLRAKVDRIQLWTRSKDLERVNNIAKRMVKLLDVSEADGVGLEFQYNSDDRPPPNKYLSIHANMPQSGFRPNFDANSGAPPALAPSGGPPGRGGAFGAFGTGGTFGNHWRGSQR